MYIDKYIDIYLAYKRKYVYYDGIGCGTNVKVSIFFFLHF